jgi:hypothetical protein
MKGECMEDFEMYIISKGLKLEQIDEQIINDYCSDLFYDLEDSEDLDKLNILEEEIRSKYLGGDKNENVW